MSVRCIHELPDASQLGSRKMNIFGEPILLHVLDLLASRDWDDVVSLS
jgi:hypothetical protein